LPHLDKPLLLTDYLMDSLDMGKQLLQRSDSFTLLHATAAGSSQPVF
jgi:hypothetical protein